MADSRYIDAEALDTRVCDSMNLATNPDPILKLMHIHDHKLFRTMIEEAPTVDVVPVIHARWEPRNDVPGFCRCSNCKNCNVYEDWPDGKKWSYCPECGARMDGESDG